MMTSWPGNHSWMTVAGIILGCQCGGTSELTLPGQRGGQGRAGQGRGGEGRARRRQKEKRGRREQKGKEGDR